MIDSGSNVKVKMRESNMELLRIVAMLLVMVVHANFRALGWPSSLGEVTPNHSILINFFVESFSIICVNIFVFCLDGMVSVLNGTDCMTLSFK